MTVAKLSASDIEARNRIRRLCVEVINRHGFPAIHQYFDTPENNKNKYVVVALSAEDVFIFRFDSIKKKKPDPENGFNVTGGVEGLSHTDLYGLAFEGAWGPEVETGYGLYLAEFIEKHRQKLLATECSAFDNFDGMGR